MEPPLNPIDNFLRDDARYIQLNTVKEENIYLDSIY